jgi:thiol-disulfide isomerase/thioredoxin
MKSVFAALALLPALPAILAADPPQEMVGRLDPEPVPDKTGYMPVRLEPAPAGTAKELPAPPAEGDRLFAGSLAWSRDKKRDARVVLVEPAQGEAFLYADTDLDGKLSAAERHALTAEGKGFPATVLRLPWKDGPFRFYPVHVMRPASVRGMSTDQGQRLLMASNSAHLQGAVEIDGRKTLVRYTFSRGDNRLDPLKGVIGIDVDGDGTIDPFFGSPEVDVAEGAPAVFPVGERYVSVRTIDPAAGRIVLRTHPASDSKRFDLSVGAQIPDFAFQDFDGKTRRLSDFRGKHVLLDFWASWCVPCVAEFPHLKKMYETYRSRGFEILGLNRDESAGPARAMIREKQLPWINATPESARDVVLQRFRALEIPVIVLLDPEGRVVTRGVPGTPGLQKEELTAMLEKRLPAQGAGR